MLYPRRHEILYQSGKGSSTAALITGLRLLEPYGGKLSRTVLSGEGAREGFFLPDYSSKDNNWIIKMNIKSKIDKYAQDNNFSGDISIYRKQAIEQLVCRSIPINFILVLLLLRSGKREGIIIIRL